MSEVYITEYAWMASVPNAGPRMPMEPPIAEQTVAIGTSSAQSANFNAKTRFVRLHTDSICSVEFDTNPTAAGTSGRLAANQTEYRGVPEGRSFKLAVIANSP